MAHSTLRKKPAKPNPDFPLFAHASGYWAKKVRGRFHYFGRWADDPKGEGALELWLEQKDDLLAGRTPRANREGLTVHVLFNHFMAAKEQQRDGGDITRRTYDDYWASCKFALGVFEKNRFVDDLVADDFQALRAKLARRYGVHRLGNMVQHIRTAFKFAYEAGLIDRPIRFGPTFKKPAKRIMRTHRQKLGPRMFDPAELRKIINEADQPLKSMILLGINCGFGNHDCGTLPRSAVNLKAGWVDYPRPKTAIERRCPLWPETIKAVRASLKHRPKSKQREHDTLVFVTRCGKPWSKETRDNPISAEFRKLLDALNLYRPGLGFYALRHTLETIGGDARDQVAVNHIMGHADSSMAGIYRERISDERLRDVVTHVHKWLFDKRKAK